MLNDRPRIVRCTIEMELVEGEHFNHSGMNLSDEDAQIAASTSFVNSVQIMLDSDRAFENSELNDYVQTKVVEEKS